MVLFATSAGAQAATPQGEWLGINGGASSTRYSPLDQLNASNFNRLQIAWQWKGTDSPIDIGGETLARNLPIYAKGKLITTAGPKRTVVALDPVTGKTLWAFQEPETPRWAYSMRASHGKGVAYAEIDGKGVVYVTTPAFFLHALDAESGKPLAGWGKGIPIPGFPSTGTVDMVADIIKDWDPWLNLKQPYDPAKGIPLEIGYITTSATPPSRVTTRRASKTSRATSSPTTRAPAPSSGSSTSFRGPASSGTKRGRTTRGSGRETSHRGRRCRRIRNAAWSTFRRTAPRWISTVASVRATTCSARA